MNVTTIPTAASTFIPRDTDSCDVMPAHPVYGEPRKPRLGEIGLIAPLDDDGKPREYPVIGELPTPLGRMSRMADGTYLQDRAGVWHDYAARWSYGYIVAIRPATDVDIEEPYNLIGVWKNPESGHVYVDVVEHVSDIDTALDRARERG